MPNDKGLWCPTRGYLADDALEAAAPEAAAPEAAAPEAAAASATAASGASAAGAGGGGKSLWTPTRGYIGGGSGGAAPAAPAAAPAAAAAAAPVAKTAAAGAAPAAKKAKASKADAKPAAAKEPEVDPERDSIETVESLVEHKVFSDIAEQVFTEPDSETTLYRVPALNIAFALSSLLLLITTLMVFWQDYDRQWKTIQADWRDTLVDNYEEEREGVAEKQLPELIGVASDLEAILRKLHKDDGTESEAASILEALPATPKKGSREVVGTPAFQRVNRLLRRIESLRGSIRGLLEDSDKYKELSDETVGKGTAAVLQDMNTRAFRGDFQAAKFVFEEEKKHLLEHGHTKVAVRAVADLTEKFNAEYVEVLEAKDRELERLQEKARQAKESFDTHVVGRTSTGTTDFAALEARVGTLVHPVNTVTSRLALIENNWRNAARNAPLLDFMAPTYKIDKVVTPDLHEPLNFLTVERVHRCKSCHRNIDDSDPEVVEIQSKKWGSVYQSHPRLDLFLSAASPHPYQEFGCTTCHYGDGHALDFTIAAHIPRDEHQGHEWHEKYGWHEFHHQDFPMLPAQFSSSSCTKCHQDQWRLEGADTLNLGAEIVRSYGCFGCHKIDGFEVATADDAPLDRVWKLDRVGPNLKHVADKADPEFLRRWVRQPSHFRTSTRMPQFFDLSNTRGTMRVIDSEEKQETIDFERRNGVESLALATFLFDKSVRRELPDVTATGDARRGREIVKSIGCLGCHSIKIESETADEDPMLNLAATKEALEAAAAAQKHPALAVAYRDIRPRLDSLFRWLDRLDVGKDIESLYHEARVVIEKAQALEEKLEIDPSALENSSRLASSVYDRWVHNTFGPDLSTIARKFDLQSDSGREKAQRWLSDWIVDPSGHDPDTVMPSLRIEKDADGEQKVADIVAYLLTLDYTGVAYAALPGARPETLASAEAKKARDDAWQDGVSVLTPPDIEGSDALGKILDEIAFDHLRRNHSTTEAKRLLDGESKKEPITPPMTVSEKLIYVGHRLVRRYGCYACHNGILDEDPDPAPPEPRDPNLPLAYFDTAQPIGAELNKWGAKPADKLDYGQWGHQHGGGVAIAHNRGAWATAKLSDTRRFDVLPKPQSAGHGKVVYANSDRLVQKKPEELLKMPLFPFHDDPEQVEAVVNFVISLVDDPIRPQKKKKLDTEESILEAGGRLVEKLNCSGCHRLGATTQFVNVEELPNPNAGGEENERTGVMEPETWLARDTRLVARPVVDPKNPLLGIELPRNFPLSIPIGQRISSDSEETKKIPPVFSPNEDAMSVVDAARRSFDPLPGFMADLARALDAVIAEDVGFTNQDIFDWVTGRLADKSGDPAAQLVQNLRRELELETTTPLGDLLFLLRDEDPYGMDLESSFSQSGVDRSIFVDLAGAYYASRGVSTLPYTPPSERLLAVKGFHEGGIRFYSGTSPLDRYKAPPPLMRQGERVRSDWFFHFLLDVQPIRPWLSVRMPSFRLSQDEARLLVQWFKANAGVPYGDEVFEEDTLNSAQAGLGRLLFGKGETTVGGTEIKGRECNACHPRGSTLPSLPQLEVGSGRILPAEVPLHAPGESDFLAWKSAGGTVLVEAGYDSVEAALEAGKKRFEGTDTVWAAGGRWDKSGWGPDLVKAAERLRADWMRQWLYYPPDFMPGTKMPNLFVGQGERSRYQGLRADHIDDDEKKQVDALLQYLIHMNKIDVAVSSRPGEGAGETGGGGR